MTTTDQPRPFSTWLAHHRQHIITAWFIIVAAEVFVLPKGLWALLVAVPAGAAVWVALVADWRHDGILCPKCVEGFPTLGGQEAQEKKWWLNAYHRRIVGVLMMLSMLGALVFSWLIIGTAACVLIDYRIDAIHRRLQPWCRGCHDDDPDETPAPQPVPTSEGTRG